MKENEWVYFKDTKILVIKIDKMGKNNGWLKLKWEICNWKIHLLLILQLKEKKTWERKSEDVEGWNEMVSQ